MDDNAERPVVEFPWLGGYIAVKRPTDSQLMLLALSRAGDDPVKMVRRMVTLLENLVGAEAWADIESQLMSEQGDVPDLLVLLGEIARFKWSDLDKEQTPESVMADSEPIVTAPQPRVVKRA